MIPPLRTWLRCGWAILSLSGAAGAQVLPDLPEPASLHPDLRYIPEAQHLDLGLSRLVLGWEESAGRGELSALRGETRPHWRRLGPGGRPALFLDGDDLVGPTPSIAGGSYTLVTALTPEDTTGSLPREEIIASQLRGDGRTGMAFGLDTERRPVLQHPNSDRLVGDTAVSPGVSSILFVTFHADRGMAELFLNERFLGAGPVEAPPAAELWIGAEASCSGASCQPQERLGFRGELSDFYFFERALTRLERSTIFRRLNERYGETRPRVSFMRLPRDGQLFSRTLTGSNRNRAFVHVSGHVLDAGYDRVEMRIHRNSWDYAPVASAAKTLGEAPGSFQFSLPIVAGLANYHLRVDLVRRGETVTVAERENLVCGDAYLIQGQSNALSADYLNEGRANDGDFQAWIRSFGTTDFGRDLMGDLYWDAAAIASPETHGGYYGHASIGVWGLRMAEDLVARQRVPVAILNGALGGTFIAHHQRNEGNPFELNAVFGKAYGRLLYRATQAEVAETARAFLWYQGESDTIELGSGSPRPFSVQYDDYLFQLQNPGPEPFVNLLWDLGQDYPRLERIYVFQTRDAQCGADGAGIREALRQAQDLLGVVRTVSTTAVPGYLGCHYNVAGYEKIGQRAANMIAYDLYGVGTMGVYAPNLERAYWLNPTSRKRIVLEFRRPVNLRWGYPQGQIPGSEVLFTLDNGQRLALDSISNNMITLRVLGNTPSPAQWISYGGVPDPDVAGVIPWITNAQGVGALTFAQVPIQ